LRTRFEKFAIFHPKELNDRGHVCELSTEHETMEKKRTRGKKEKRIEKERGTKHKTMKGKIDEGKKSGVNITRLSLSY
jgi:hypothetical protein